MNAKHIILILFCLAICQIGEAQILKKLSKKAEQAVERTVLKKTDEIVTEKTENTIDGAVKGNENNTETQNIPNNTDPSNQTHQANPALNPMASANTKTNMPEAYAFDWEYKTELKTSEKDSMDMNFLIGSSNKDYFGMVISNEEIKKQGGTITMVTDSKAKISIMFMDVSGQKMAQTTTIKESKANKNEAQYSMKEIGSKTILGYESYGMEVENADYIATIYFTLDAPVNFSAFFAFANNKNAPKGFDPALLQVLKEDALIMEMTAVNKKKSKESFTMTAISLEQKETTIKTKDYQVMNMGGF